PANNSETPCRARRNAYFRRDHETRKSPAALIWTMSTEDKPAPRARRHRPSICLALVRRRARSKPKQLRPANKLKISYSDETDDTRQWLRSFLRSSDSLCMKA